MQRTIGLTCDVTKNMRMGEHEVKAKAGTETFTLTLPTSGPFL
jgi:hypothetical protein